MFTVTRAIDTWALGLMLYEIFVEEPLMLGCYRPSTCCGAPSGEAPAQPRTAEAFFKQLSQEDKDGYVHWLADGGAKRLVDKLELTSHTLLNSSHLTLIKKSARVRHSPLEARARAALTVAPNDAPRRNVRMRAYRACALAARSARSGS